MCSTQVTHCYPLLWLTTYAIGSHKGATQYLMWVTNSTNALHNAVPYENPWDYIMYLNYASTHSPEAWAFEHVALWKLLWSIFAIYGLDVMTWKWKCQAGIAWKQTHYPHNPLCVLWKWYCMLQSHTPSMQPVAHPASDFQLFNFLNFCLFVSSSDQKCIANGSELGMQVA